MTFEERLEVGRRVVQDAADTREQLHSLMQDPRSAALLGWLEARQREFMLAGAAQKMAPHHGSLAHCAGSVFAYQQILDELRATHDAAPRRSRKESGAVQAAD